MDQGCGAPDPTFTVEMGDIMFREHVTLLRVRFYHAVIGKDAAQYSINS